MKWSSFSFPFLLSWTTDIKETLAELGVQDDTVTGLTTVPTALGMLSKDHWSQSVALCVMSLCTSCSSQHDCWVSRSRNHPFSLGMGPETWKCHILCIIMDRVHHKNHSDSGEGGRSSASWSKKRGTQTGWGRSDGDITKSSIEGGSLYVITTTFCCFLTQPWPSEARSDHIILPLGCHNTLQGRSMFCSCNWASLSPTSGPPCDTMALWILNLVLLAAPQTFQTHSYLKDFVFALFPPVCLERAQQVSTRFLPSNQAPGKLIWLP